MALLSLERSRQARTLRAWSARDLESLAGRFDALRREWQTEWGVRDSGSGSSRVEPATPAMAAQPWLQAGVAGEAFWYRPDDEFEIADVIGSGLFGVDLRTRPGSSSMLARLTAQDAWHDLANRIARLFDGAACSSDDSGPPGCGGWSGAAAVTLRLASERLHLLLSGDQIAHLLGGDRTLRAAPGRAAERVPLVGTLSDKAVRLQVRLEGAEVTVGQIRMLQAGDVIRLDHLLDRPAQVTDSSNTPRFQGWLGQSDGTLAVELHSLID